MGGCRFGVLGCLGRTEAKDGATILAMQNFQVRISRLWVVVLGGFLVAFLVAAVVAGQAPEPVSSGRDRFEGVSPAGMATAEGELRRLW